VVLHDAVNIFFYALILLLFANAILSFFPLPPSNPVRRFISGAVRPVLEPFSRRIPPVGIIDVSPLVAIWALFLINALIQYTLPAGW
jgi:YggT family protein